MDKIKLNKKNQFKIGIIHRHYTTPHPTTHKIQYQITYFSNFFFSSSLLSFVLNLVVFFFFIVFLVYCIEAPFFETISHYCVNWDKKLCYQSISIHPPTSQLLRFIWFRFVSFRFASFHFNLPICLLFWFIVFKRAWICSFFRF